MKLIDRLNRLVMHFLLYLLFYLWFVGQVTTVLTIAFLAGIPGAITSLLVGKRFRGTKTPLVIALGILMASMIVAPLVMVNQSDANLAKLFGALWGLLLGFVASWDEPYFTGLIPGGQVSCFSQAAPWALPLTSH